jgi:hypothetical protein
MTLLLGVLFPLISVVSGIASLAALRKFVRDIYHG